MLILNSLLLVTLPQFFFSETRVLGANNQSDLAPVEIEALQILYISTDGPNWAWTNGSIAWNFSGNPKPCFEGWYGVDCTTATTGGYLHVLKLNLSSWKLAGKLPKEVGNFTLATTLDLSFNSLTGSIPYELGILSQLLYLYLYSNELTGTLPPELGGLRQLVDLDLNANELTGTIPRQLSNLTNAEHLYLDSNYLTGSLPSNFLLNNPYLMAMNLADNFLTGTIALTLFQLPRMEYMQLSNNLLTGTLNYAVTTLQHMGFLSVAYNHLWGCLPAVGGFSFLQELDVSHNQLRCSLDGVFDGFNRSSILINIQLGNNQFTGTLPAVLFSFPILQTLVAVSNCFTGTLPEEICQATRVHSLILDGIGSSSSCPTVWTTWQREGKLRIPRNFHGTIPECLFGLPFMASLHLSGNNLIGSIPGSVILTKNLSQLFLSHNQLSGSIPVAVQTHAWSQLDLSYNRFSGSLLPSFGVGTLQGPFNASANVNVDNCRLSGEIPATVLQLPQVSMLGTNMFACKGDKSDVPNTDGNGDKQRYQCGSDSFNYGFYLFLSLAGAAACVVLLLRYTTVAFANNLLIGSLAPNCQGVMTILLILCQVAVYCCVPLLLVLVPWYSAASHYYGTYTHQYAWVVSAAFLSGLAPGLVEFFLWSGVSLVVLLATIFLCRGQNGNSLLSPLMTDAEDDPRGTTPWSVRIQTYALFLGVNLTVVIGVNVAFVYVSLNESSDAVQVAQVALSLFKFGWNTVGVPFLISQISRHLMPVRESKGFFRVQAFIGLFNNIAIPCLVVAAQSPSCFRDVLFPPDDVNSSYSTQDCGFVSVTAMIHYIDCTTPSAGLSQSIYTPQFSYSYECSSSFVTYYSAAMVYFALTAAVLVPAVRLLLCWVVRHTSVESTIHQWSNAALPRLWRVAQVEAVKSRNVGNRLLNANYLLVNMTVYLGILLSFGVVFPPVALAMCVAMLSTAYQTRLAVGRLLCNAREVGALHVVEALEQDCRGVASLEKLQSMIGMAIVFACYFYALFIFDTIGDAEGLVGACWVLALWVAVPVFAAAYLWISSSKRDQNLGDRVGVSTVRVFSWRGQLVEVSKGSSSAVAAGDSSSISALHA